MNIVLFYYLFQVLWAIPTLVLSHTATYSNSSFQVSTLPDSPALPTSWAGRLPVPGRQGNEIFFWLFEAEVPAYDENLISTFNLIYFGPTNATLTLHSLAEWWPRLLIAHRPHNRERTHCFCRKLYSPRFQPILVDKAGSCPIRRSTCRHGLLACQFSRSDQ